MGVFLLTMVKPSDLNSEQTYRSEINPSQWSSFASTCLEGTVPHLEFSIEIQSNNLTYQGNPFTEYQQFLYTLIKCLQDYVLREKRQYS